MFTAIKSQQTLWLKVNQLIIIHQASTQGVKMYDTQRKQVYLKDKYSFWKREFSFGVEENLQNNSPSRSYFWYRKTKQVVDLFKSNTNLFSDEDNNKREKLFIEIGCGRGEEIFAIRSILDKRIGSFKYIGFEGAPMHLEMCELRRMFHIEDNQEPDNISFSRIDISNFKLPFQSEKADIVYCSEVIEHLPEPELFLSNIYDCMNSGGYLILTTPNEPNVFQRSFWLSERRKKGLEKIEDLKNNALEFPYEDKVIKVYGHISCKKIHEWEELLEGFGFELIDFRRGPISQGNGLEISDQNFVLGLRILGEAVLDILPKKISRPLSGQLIGLYRKK
jgi:SAM-dependent methyltransferase